MIEKIRTVKFINNRDVLELILYREKHASYRYESRKHDISSPGCYSRVNDWFLSSLRDTAVEMFLSRVKSFQRKGYAVISDYIHDDKVSPFNL